ncbi:MAG: ATP synthase F1 subunit gamma [Bacteroides sp.]|nr:ATP synthase F1 subunit gamma [Bacteroides sp.]
MATLRELKTRIGSVSSSEKITGAMKMISSAKVHKFEQALRRLLPYKTQIQSIMGHILESGCDFTSPLIEQREVKSVAVVVFGSDDGLCGAYNVNIFKAAVEALGELRSKYGAGLDIRIIPVGKKITKIFNVYRRAKDSSLKIEEMEGINSKMEGSVVDGFTNTLKDRFLTGDVDLVEVFYMKYYSMSRQRFQKDTLFPVSPEALGAEGSTGDKLYLFEPDPNSIFNEVLPMFALSTMQELTLENRASEQAARVMAMQSANDNAHKLLEQLQLDYNKLRQQSITSELLDIVGGQVDR